MAALLFRSLFRAGLCVGLGLSLGGAVLAADPALNANTAADPNAPQPAELEEALPLLQQYYYNPSALQSAHTAQDLPALLPHLRGVAFLNPPDGASPIHNELLPGQFGYWRITSFSFAAKGGKTLELGAKLNEWTTNGLRGMIVDLRHCRDSDSGDNGGAFDAATRIASAFLPDGTILFSIQALQLPQKLYQTAAVPHPFAIPPLVVLTDRATEGAAEVLATVLRQQAGAIVIGQTTPGDEALFTFAKLSSGRLLRIPIAPVLLPDGTSLLGTPVAPDIAVYVDDRVQGQVLAQIALGTAAQGLVEAPIRLRLNENALVHEENPEIDEILAEQARAAHKDMSAPLQDLTLMRALDVLKGIALFPSTAPPETTPPAPPALH